MADNSATATLHGSLSVSGWQSAAEAQLDCEHVDLTAGQESAVIRTEGNNSVMTDVAATKVTNPAKTHSLPSNLATNPLGRGSGR